MSTAKQKPELFAHGSTWVRADFHLHTRADKEFVYTGKNDTYISNYVESLAASGVRVGVITNHNKFDAAEFLSLRKHARHKEIFLLPGVELSVNDGANGIHILVVFSEQWLENGEDYINPCITSLFPGKAVSEYENENGRSPYSLLQVVEALRAARRDFFLIFAHVEEKSGLWKELGGGRIGDFKGDTYRFVRVHTLGFQKVRTYNKPNKASREQVKEWLGRSWYPAEVEGSDCKSVEEIGKGRACFLKLGSSSFNAIQYALVDKDHRVAAAPVQHTHSHIRSIRFTGGTLNGQELRFSPELNTLIGIRGSGKSSILEVLRYALEIPFGEKSGDKEYKEKLIGFTLGGGGKIEIDAVDRYGQNYVIRRIWRESHSDILIDGIAQPGVSLQETVIHKPIYFGQKDLSITGEGFGKDLVDKLLGSKLDNIRREIEFQKQNVSVALDKLLNITHVQEQIAEQQQIKEDSEYRLIFYKEHGVEQKLQKRLDYDKDVRVMDQKIALSRAFVTDLENVLVQYEDDLKAALTLESEHNSDLFEQFHTLYQTYVSLIDATKTWIDAESATRLSLTSIQTELANRRSGMVEEFAEIERKLADELRSKGTQNISSEEFLSLKKKLNAALQLITELKRQESDQKNLEHKLLRELSILNDLWHEEFLQVKKELDKVGGDDSPLAIESGYKDDKTSFLTFTKDIFRGSGIRETTFKGLTDAYPDFIEIYKDLENVQKHFGSSPEKLRSLIMENLKSLLTYKTPNTYTILYRGKELQAHSLGQRASALILFVLSQKEHDVIIIDQPEDDLDNQTIYEDVIKLVQQMKPKTQFIFATHNPNIPVLGDAELVHSCTFMDDTEVVFSGSIDHGETQKRIVKIMEGGKEAFDRRKEIYQIWKP